MEATLITGWEALCQLFAPAFTKPTLVTFLHVAKHWTVYERFFYRAAWSLETVSMLLLQRIAVPLLRRHAVEAVIDLVIDDTTSSRTGKHVAWAGYFKDASVSNTLAKVVHWSHNWIIGCVVFRPRRWPNWVMSLPVLFALYRKRKACDGEHPFRTRQELAAAMIHQVHEMLPDGPIRVAADGQYATRTVVQAAATAHTNLVSRIRRDAALYVLPARRPARHRGRPAKRGKRLPCPKQLAARRSVASMSKYEGCFLSGIQSAG